MGTIYFDDKDIKESKIALVNQKITPLQSAFLMQYITNLEEQLQQKENIINRTKEFIQNKDVDVCTIRNNDIQDVKNIVLEILDNKGSDK